MRDQNGMLDESHPDLPAFAGFGPCSELGAPTVSVVNPAQVVRRHDGDRWTWAGPRPGPH